MASFEVTFTVYSKVYSGGATVSTSGLTNQKTVVQANNHHAAQQLVEAQYGPNCKATSARQL